MDTQNNENAEGVSNIPTSPGDEPSGHNNDLLNNAFGMGENLGRFSLGLDCNVEDVQLLGDGCFTYHDLFEVVDPNNPESAISEIEPNTSWETPTPNLFAHPANNNGGQPGLSMNVDAGGKTNDYRSDNLFQLVVANNDISTNGNRDDSGNGNEPGNRESRSMLSDGSFMDLNENGDNNNLVSVPINVLSNHKTHSEPQPPKVRKPRGRKPKKIENAPDAPTSADFIKPATRNYAPRRPKKADAPPCPNVVVHHKPSNSPVEMDSNSSNAPFVTTGYESREFYQDQGQISLDQLASQNRNLLLTHQSHSHSPFDPNASTSHSNRMTASDVAAANISSQSKGGATLQRTQGMIGHNTNGAFPRHHKIPEPSNGSLEQLVSSKISDIGTPRRPMISPSLIQRNLALYNQLTAPAPKKISAFGIGNPKFSQERWMQCPNPSVLQTNPSVLAPGRHQSASFDNSMNQHLQHSSKPKGDLQFPGGFAMNNEPGASVGEPHYDALNFNGNANFFNRKFTRADLRNDYDDLESSNLQFEPNFETPRNSKRGSSLTNKPIQEYQYRNQALGQELFELKLKNYYLYKTNRDLSLQLRQRYQENQALKYELSKLSLHHGPPLILHPFPFSRRNGLCGNYCGNDWCLRCNHSMNPCNGTPSPDLRNFKNYENELEKNVFQRTENKDGKVSGTTSGDLNNLKRRQEEPSDDPTSIKKFRNVTFSDMKQEPISPPIDGDQGQMIENYVGLNGKTENHATDSKTIKEGSGGQSQSQSEERSSEEKSMESNEMEKDVAKQGKDKSPIMLFDSPKEDGDNSSSNLRELQFNENGTETLVSIKTEKSE